MIYNTGTSFAPQDNRLTPSYNHFFGRRPERSAQPVSSIYQDNTPGQDALSAYYVQPHIAYKIENDDPPPELEYNLITRTRQDYSCDGEYKSLCEEAIRENRTVNCKQRRFR